MRRQMHELFRRAPTHPVYVPRCLKLAPATSVTWSSVNQSPFLESAADHTRRGTYRQLPRQRDDH